MDRTEAIDREVGLPVGSSFPMARVYGVHHDVGLVFSEGLKQQRVGCPTVTSHPLAPGGSDIDALRAFASNRALLRAWR